MIKVDSREVVKCLLYHLLIQIMDSVQRVFQSISIHYPAYEHTRTKQDHTQA